MYYAKWKKGLDWYDYKNVFTLEICRFMSFKRCLIIYTAD